MSAPGAGRPALAQPTSGVPREMRPSADRITCAEFLALNPDDQQRIGYWVDG